MSCFSMRSIFPTTTSSGPSSYFSRSVCSTQFHGLRNVCFFSGDLGMYGSRLFRLVRRPPPPVSARLVSSNRTFPVSPPASYPLPAVPWSDRSRCFDSCVAPPSPSTPPPPAPPRASRELAAPDVWIGDAARPSLAAEALPAAAPLRPCRIGPAAESIPSNSAPADAVKRRPSPRARPPSRLFRLGRFSVENISGRGFCATMDSWAVTTGSSTFCPPGVQSPRRANFSASFLLGRASGAYCVHVALRAARQSASAFFRSASRRSRSWSAVPATTGLPIGSGIGSLLTCWNDGRRGRRARLPSYSSSSAEWSTMSKNGFTGLLSRFVGSPPGHGGVAGRSPVITLRSSRFGFVGSHGRVPERSGEIRARTGGMRRPPVGLVEPCGRSRARVRRAAAALRLYGGGLPRAV